MNLRTAKEDDLRLLARFNQELIEDEQSSNSMNLQELETRMRSWLRAEYEAILFEADGESCGYAVFRPADSDWYIRQFFVARDRRRSGIGRQTFGMLRDRLTADGGSIFLEVLTQNPSGLAFWRAVGFKDHAVSLRLGPTADAV